MEMQKIDLIINALDHVDTFNWNQQDHKLIQEALAAARELGLDYEPGQDHGFDRTASHMAGEYVDTAQPKHEAIYEYSERGSKTRIRAAKTWQGLTDDEVQQTCYEIWSLDPYVVAQAIEAKLREKNR
jgi:hypothetical protein